MLREILEHILVDFDDKNLLKASHVCKLFASVVETVFARKYSDQYFHFDGREMKKSYGKVMLTKYGGKIRWISVVDGDDEILGLIEEKCRSLERVKLVSVSKMIHLKDMKEVSLMSVDNLDREEFAEFISHNQQIEALALDDTDLNVIEVLDGLNSLKTLEYDHYNEFPTNLPNIRLNSLEILTLYSFQNGIYARLLRALECNQLKQLNIKQYSGSDKNDEVTNAICKFKTLTLLRLPIFMRITSNQLKKLAAHLPHLTELSIATAKKKSTSIVKYALFVLSIFPKLTKLTINLNENGFLLLSSHFEQSINEFHGRFAGTNTEIEIVNGFGIGTVFTSKDFAYVSKRESLELHWMANLNDKNVQKAMARVQNCITDLKFINPCADNTVDICAFLPEFKLLQCLDIKSNGPITFKANVSEIGNFSFLHAH